MTLSEFESKFVSRPTIAPPTTIYVFKDEDSAYNWIECKYLGSDNHAYELIMIIQSDVMLECTVKERWCRAKVQKFYAVEPDVIVVVVELQESEDEDGY